tara:strand:- start:333 stop:926 length:594 start_codon:yes stop_codon:yes gene_type:complete
MSGDIVKEIFKNAFRSKEYTFFEKGNLNLNIIGVRMGKKATNSFDDYLYVVYKVDGNWEYREYRITTDAGAYWLKNPMNNKGTAILKPNQYRGAWSIGKHQGKYLSLVQSKEVEVYRDNNKDMILDYSETTLDKGFFGINIHKSNPNKESYNVDKWSAGCQVFKKADDFDNFMDLCEAASFEWSNSFTYTLIESNDI